MAACSVALSGCGSYFVQNDSAAEALVPTPASISFGDVPVGQKVTTKVSLLNQSQKPVKISEMNVTGQSFSLDGVGKLPVTVAAGATLSVNVHFVPVSEGALTGQVTVNSVSSTKPAAISLKGRGKKGGKGTPGAPPGAGLSTLGISATSVPFGNVVVNTPATQSVTLNSTGTAPVTISAATLTGVGFTMSGVTAPLTLNPGQAATLNVQFDPAATGAATGLLTIISNSSSNGTALVNLSGTGVSHEVDLSWDAPSKSAEPVAGYHIYRSASGNAAYQLLNSSVDSQTTYMDTTVQSGLTYDYVVKSVGSSGTESSPSNTTSVTIP